MATDNWHFARPSLAQDYLATFARGLTAARGLFARRRMGKTEFLKKDLMPAARIAGYQTAYVNLWDNKENPALALVTAMYEAAEPTGLAKFLTALRRPVKKVKASAKVAGLGEGAIETELGEAAHPPASTLLSQVVRQLDTKKKPMLLIIDEAQVLAWAAHSNFAHALRSTLDVRKDYIKVIFAGSSETTLRAMFGRPSEPFYNWAPLEPFQLLGDEFVKAMVAKVNEMSRFPLDLADAQAAYAALNNTPEFFRRYLNHYLANATDGSVAALEDTKLHVFHSDTFSALWKEQSIIDQLILDMIAAGSSDLYSKAARGSLGERLGTGEVSNSTVQNALIRLTRNNIVAAVDRGRYQLEDEAFGVWIRERAQDL